jgi:hypothetical protein
MVNISVYNVLSMILYEEEEKEKNKGYSEH